MERSDDPDQYSSQISLFTQQLANMYKMSDAGRLDVRKRQQDL